MIAALSTIFVVFVFVLARASARNDCADPLSCYLESLQINIPDSCLVVEGSELCVQNFACYGINLSGLPSEYERPTTLDVNVEGLGTYCEGEYSYGRLIHGTVNALVSNTDFGVGLYIGKGGEMPVSANFSHCEITSMDVELSFSSGVMDAIAPILERMIKEGFLKLLCTNIPHFLEVNVTSALVNTVDPKLQAIIDSQPSPLPKYSGHYTAWGDSIVSKIKTIMQKVQGVADLKDFLLCMLTPETAEILQQTMISEFQALFLSGPSDGSDGDGDSDKPWSYSNKNRGSYRVGLPADVVVLSKPNFPPGYNSTVTLTSVQLRGLDTVTALDILEPLESSNVTLRTVVGFQDLAVELGLQVDIVPNGNSAHIGTGTGDGFKGKVDVRGRYTERLKATLELKDLSFLMDLVLVVNSFVLKSYYLDQLSTKACWLSAVQEISVANLQLHTTVATLQAVQVVGDAGPLEAQVLALIDNAALLVISPEGFGQLTTDLINGAMQGPLRTAFNERAAQYLQDAHKNMPCLTHVPYSDRADYVVWANSSLVQTVDFIVNDVLGYEGVNKLMNCATNGTGELALNTSRLAVSVAGLNSFYALRVLSPLPPIPNDPVRPYELESTVAVGYCPKLGAKSCNPLELIVSFNPDAALAAMGSPSSKVATTVVRAMPAFDLTVSLANFSAYLNTEVKVDKNGLRDTQYSKLGTHGCVQESFSEVIIESMNLHVADAHMTIDQGETERSNNITRIVDKVLSVLTRDDKIEKRNDQIAYELSIAEETCAAGGVAPNVVVTDDDAGSSKNTLDWQWELFILVVACLSCLVLLLAAYNYWGRAGKQFVCTPAFALERCEEESPDMPFWTRMYYRWDCKHSLLCHDQVPRWLRMATPIFILGDIAIFLASNIDPRAVSVMVQVVIGQKTIDVGSVFDFGLASTVVDMWNAGVYTLAVLILFFSGAWPYVKLLSMLLAWVAPPKLLSVARRESILVTLDVLGKWSLIDFFVMILMLCAFYFNIYIGQEIAVNVTVLPRWGFYSFLLATMVSLGLGHIILACHRLVVEPKVLPIPEEFCAKESLSSITYEIPLSDRDVRGILSASSVAVAGEDEDEDGLAVPLTGALDEPSTPAMLSAPSGPGRSDLLTAPQATDLPDAAMHARHGTTMLVQVLPLGKALVVVMLLVTAMFVIAGTFLDTMRFEFKGLVGLMLKDAAEVDYSFVSVGTAIPEHSGVPDDFAIRWLQASLFLFGQAMPFALLLALLVMWLVPMTLGWQRTFFVLAEVLNAWSALDVFCIAIAAALLEIQQFAAFIVGDSCDSINVFLEEHMDELLEGDDKCFDVVASLISDSWILFTAAALLIVVALPLLSVGSSAVHQRLKVSEQASVLLEHLSRGTADSAVRQALHSLAAEQQLQEDEAASAKDAQLTRPLLLPSEREESLGEQPKAEHSCLEADPALCKATAPSAPPAAPATAVDPSSSSGSDASSTEGSNVRYTTSSSGRDSHSSADGSEGSSAATGKETWWSLMTTHNLTLASVRALAACSMVKLSYAPTRPADAQVLRAASDSLAFYQN